MQYGEHNATAFIVDNFYPSNLYYTSFGLSLLEITIIEYSFVSSTD